MNNQLLFVTRSNDQSSVLQLFCSFMHQASILQNILNFLNPEDINTLHNVLRHCKDTHFLSRNTVWVDHLFRIRLFPAKGLRQSYPLSLWKPDESNGPDFYFHDFTEPDERTRDEHEDLNILRVVMYGHKDDPARPTWDICGELKDKSVFYAYVSKPVDSREVYRVGNIEGTVYIYSDWEHFFKESYERYLDKFIQYLDASDSYLSFLHSNRYNLPKLAISFNNVIFHK